MARQYAVDDSNWHEVVIINGYAVFMGYLTTGVRGLGVLIVTWTTVVLLGGFVSDIGRKDFWCLTGITLVQTAGVFDFLLKEKLSDMLHFFFGLAATIAAAAVIRGGRGIDELQWKSVLIALILLVVQGLVLVIILCPLGILYMFGLYISDGVSLWRLIEHDFGNEGGANQKPALQVLYGLAVAQGVLFSYKIIHALGARNRLVNLVAELGLSNVDEELLAEYLEETVAGCQKDPSFSSGRNLVTYGAGLMMEAKSNKGFIAGIRVLGGAIKDGCPSGRKVLAKHLLTSGSDFWSHLIQKLLKVVGPQSPYNREVREHAARIVALVAHDVRLEQFPRVIECVSSVLELEGPFADEESDQEQDYHFDRMRGNSAGELKDYERVELLLKYEQDYLEFERTRIRTHSPDFFASNMIVGLAYCLMCKGKATKSSERREEQRDRSRVHGFEGLLTEAANIIQQLAFIEDNRRIMSKAVIPKFSMSLLKLHRMDGDHGAILEKYWVQWLVAAIKETNSQRRVPEEGQPAAHAAGAGGGRSGEEEKNEEMSSMIGPALVAAISNLNCTVKSIFDCLECQVTEKMQGVLILLHLSLDMSFITDGASGRRRLTWMLLLIFCCYPDEYKRKHWMVISAFTGRSKDMWSSIRRLAGEMLSDMLPDERAMALHITQDITRAFANDYEDISIRIHAAMIMEHLCTRYYYSHIIMVDDVEVTSSYNPHPYITKDDMEGILVGVIKKVVKEILVGCASTGEERQAQDPDLEKGISEANVPESSMDKQRFRKALVSLYQAGYMKHCVLRPKFVEIAVRVCEEQGKSFEDFKELLV